MYLGIGTHKRYSQVAVSGGNDNLQEESRLPNDRLEELTKRYTGAEAAIEASSHYRPMYRMLNEHHNVTLVNPSKNRTIADAAVKTDRVDAKRLALMLRADMLAEIYVPPDEIPQFADLVRTRKSLVEERTTEKNRVRAVLTRMNNTHDIESFGPTGRKILSELPLSDTDRTIIEAHLSVIDNHDQQIERLGDRTENTGVASSPAAADDSGSQAVHSRCHRR